MPKRSTMPLPPDAYAAAAFCAVLLLEWLAPLHLLPQLSLYSPATLIGGVLAFGGLILEIAAARALTRVGTTTRPNGAPEALARDGVFAISRNPFYGGIILLLTGVFVAASLDWFILIVPLFWLALDRLVVPFEERRLEQAFGPSYRDYAATTRRWL